MQPAQQAITVLSAIEHMRKRSMWLGSFDMIESSEIMVNDAGHFYEAFIQYPPAYLQMLMEVLTNCADHKQRNPKEVSAINIKYKEDIGEFEVSNNGPGIPIEPYPQEGLSRDYHDPSRDIYMPEVIARVPFSGANFDDDASRISGGTNGLGIKLIVVNSNRFIITTVWRNPKTGEKLRYRQTFRKGGDIVELPIIKKAENDAIEGTVMSFIPEYAARFNITTGAQPEFFKRMVNLIRGRIYLMSAWFPSDMFYMYNGRRIILPSPGGIAGLGLTIYNDMIKATLLPKPAITNGTEPATATEAVEPPVPNIMTTTIQYEDLPWEVAVIIGTTSRFQSPRVSLVNGLVVRSGTHYDRVRDAIMDAVKDKVEELFKKFHSQGIKYQPRYVRDCMSIYLRCLVDKPQFESQTKTALKLPPRGKMSKFDETFIKMLSTAITNNLQVNLLKELFIEAVDANARQQRNRKCEYAKYEAAQHAGTAKHSLNCALFLAEGDSAMSMIREGLNDQQTGLSRNYYGLFSLQGVIPNLRRVVHPVMIDGDGKHHRLKPGDDMNEEESAVAIYEMDSGEHSQRIYDNETLKNLEVALGLVRGRHYNDYMNPINNTKYNIRYGHVIVMVDRDLDGIGNIHGLIVNYFHLFWPELLEQGFVKVVLTPIIRAIPRGSSSELQMQEFGLQRDFARWFETLPGDQRNKYDIEYYKGLASHETPQVIYMFRRFKNYLVTYIPGEGFGKKLELFFGADTDARKRELSQPLIELPDEKMQQIQKNHLWFGVDHLQTETKSYQLDNLGRKLPNMVDGMIEVRRKLAYGACMKQRRKQKVFQVAGEIANTMHYHHGNDSLCKSLIGMAQRIPGVNRFPYFFAGGQFGTLMGTEKGIGTDFGAPRYISTVLLRRFFDAMFPVPDRFLVPPKYDDGEMVEPYFLMPVLPTCILETNCLPAHGWKAEIHARNFSDVISVTRGCIHAGGTDTPESPKIMFRMDLDGLNCMVHINTVTGKRCIAGRCSRITNAKKSDNYIVIHSLPPRIGGKWFAQVLKDNFAKYDSENEDKINAEVTSPGAANDLIHIRINGDILQRLIEKKQAARAATLETIQANWKDESTLPPESEYKPPLDPIADVLGLYTIISDHLNFMSPVDPLDFNKQESYVKSYTKYGDVFRDWFNVRKQYYSFRIDREIEILKVQIEFYEQQLRFIELKQSWMKGDEMSVEELRAYIMKNNFPLFSVQLIKNPGPARAEMIRNICMRLPSGDSDMAFKDDTADDLGDNEVSKEDTNEETEVEEAAGNSKNNKILSPGRHSYDYLLNLRARDITTTGADKLRNKIAELRNKIAEIDDPVQHVPFRGAKVWLKELDYLEKVIAEGRASNWAFGYNTSKHFV